MADLYGIGCAQCNREVAAALKEMPHMDGYLDTLGYRERYNHIADEATWPKPYLDGTYMEHTVATVAAEDGWLLSLHTGDVGRVHTCSCGHQELVYEVWRGRVEIR